MNGGVSRRLWWLWVVIGVIAVFLIAFFVGRATTGEEEVADEGGAIPKLPAPTLVITERQNGATVLVGKGWLVLLQLPGVPEESAWNIHLENPDLVQILPGPQVSYPSYETGADALFTYGAITLAEGDVRVKAENVDIAGKVNTEFNCIVRIASDEALSTTTTTGRLVTTESSTTASESTTTTTESTTTTTQATTTTTQATTTTTQAPTTTTKPPTTTTTKPPTTTTTKPPTTTTVRPTPPVTLPPLPPVEIPLGTVVVSPKDNGQALVMGTKSTGFVVALPHDNSGNWVWELRPVNTAVLAERGEPTFLAGTADPNVGALIWTFNVVGEGTTEVKFLQKDQAGTVVQQFYVLVGVYEVTITPF